MLNGWTIVLTVALGMVAGSVVGVILWLAALEDARRAKQWFTDNAATEKHINRHHDNELWYWQALATRDRVFLDALGERAGLLTVFNGPGPWATAEAREHAAALYESARCSLAKMDAGAQ